MRSFNEIENFLNSLDLFSHLDQSAIKDLNGQIETIKVFSGDELIRQGDPGDSMYIVHSGRLQILFVKPKGGERVVGEVGRGECVGEMALIAEENRSTTVRAIRDSELIKFSKSAFNLLLEKYPTAMLKIARIIVQRYIKIIQEEPKDKIPAIITILPNDPNVPMLEFCMNFSKSLSKYGSILYLNKENFKKKFSKNGGQPNIFENDFLKGSIFGKWFCDRESENKFILLEADNELTPWTQFCLRQCDRIFVVGFGNSNNNLNNLLADALSDDRNKITAQKNLILIYTEKSFSPFRTKTWLESTNFESHFHVHLKSFPDFERLSRYLVGEAVGLVLGGGGARSFAQIGVIKAIKESGIPIDFTGGTSMGATIAAQYSLGWDYQKMLDVNIRCWVKNNPLRCYTVPYMSLLGIRKFNEIFKYMFGDIQIEDMPLSFFCLSTNLTEATPEIHLQGDLWSQAKASSSLPGLSIPVFIGESFHVDGAIINHLPADIMKKKCKGKVLAIDVSVNRELIANEKWNDNLSQTGLLLKKISPFNNNFNTPNLWDILFRTALVNSLNKNKEVKKSVDFCFEPPVQDFKLLDFKSIKPIIDLGYESAIPVIDECKNALGV